MKEDSLLWPLRLTLKETGITSFRNCGVPGRSGCRAAGPCAQYTPYSSCYKKADIAFNRAQSSPINPMNALRRLPARLLFACGIAAALARLPLTATEVLPSACTRETSPVATMIPSVPPIVAPALPPLAAPAVAPAPLPLPLAPLPPLPLPDASPPVAAAQAPAPAACIGHITKVVGNVQFLRPESIRREKAAAGTEILERFVVLTSDQSSATLQLIDDSSVVLDQNSRLEARDAQNFFQKAGIAYYDIKSRKTGASLKVGTEFALIGVKGTQFIVNAAEGKGNITLRTGRLGIEALTGEFAIHRRKITSEFEEYLRQQQEGYDEFKQKLQDDFIEYKKEFTLEPLKAVFIEGNKVVERGFTQDELMEFSRLEALR